MVRTRDTRNARLRLTTAKRDMQRLTRAALHRCWTDLSQRIQCCADTGDLRGMYQGIKEAIGPTSKKTVTVLPEDDRSFSDPGKQLDRWADHFSSLYNKDVPVKQEAINALPLFPTLHELDADIPLSAVKVAIKLLRNNKASGADGIPAEVLKCGGEALVADLHSVFELCLRTHYLLQHFKDANIITLQEQRKSAGLQQL